MKLPVLTRANPGKGWLTPLAFLLTLAVSACGGGGGSDSGASSGPVVYSGNLNAAVVTTDNARTLAFAALGSTTASVVVAGLGIQYQQPVQTPGPLLLGPRLNRYLRAALSRVAGSLGPTGRIAPRFVVQQTVPCGVSGSVTFSGTLSDATGTGTLSVTFNTCTEVNAVLNGPATFRIDAFDPVYVFFTDTTTSFSALQLKVLTTISFPGIPVSTVLYDVTASGSLRSQVTIATNRELLSGNLVTRDNANGKLQKVDNLGLVLDYNNVLSPSFYSLSTTSGRVFDSIEGYVDAATTASWSFQTLEQVFPVSGGSLVLTGALNARIVLTPVSGTQVKVELDLDADGVFELSSTMLWTALRRPAGNTAPVANAGSSQTVPKGIAVMLDGSSSSDAESDFLSYQWTLAQKPNGSLAQLSSTTSVRPSFTPDLEGSYVVNLVVSDGHLSSASALVTLTAFNIAPIAKADSLLLGYSGVQVLLQGSQSSDGNNDPLTFNWTLTLKPPGSGTSLSGADTATPSFTPDMIGIYRFTLTVNDGTVNSQPVSITAYMVPAPSSVPQLQVPGDYPTIQAAIDAASPGGVIAVGPGTYTGNLRFNGKNVTLQSTSGPSKTIVAGVNDTAVDIGPNGAIIGFTIRDGAASFGAGMAVHGSGTLIKSNLFDSNNQGAGGFGAAIGGNSASPVIDGNLFRNNSCDNQFLSGVISFVNGSSPLIVNNVIENNPCRAINMTLPEGSAPQVINNTLVSNRTGVYVDRRVSTVQQIYRNNLIVGNEIGMDVVFGVDAQNPTWQNNLVFGNGTNYSGIADQTGLSGNISVDPMFLDYADRVYYLNAGSPAIDQGSATGAPSADFLGRTRPIDGNGDTSAVVDIGAFEFQVP